MQNPFNGIESRTIQTDLALTSHFIRIHSMELKARVYYLAACTTPHMNPFNGIERARASQQNPSGTPRIHSMELKVLATPAPMINPSAVSNPFNGIERVLHLRGLGGLVFTCQTQESIQWN